MRSLSPLEMDWIADELWRLRIRPSTTQEQFMSTVKVWQFFAAKDLPTDARRWVHTRRVVLLGTVAWLFAHFVSGGRFP